MVANMIPVCEICGKSNWPKQAWMHTDCHKPNNTASKTKHGAYSDKDKRREYMRRYMEKRRKPNLED